jgi:hypothetical protein
MWSNCFYASDIWAGEQANELQLSAICKLRYSGYRSFVISHLMPLFRPFVTGSDKSDWDFGLAIHFSPFTLLRRSTVSRFKLCLLLKEVECFRALCKRLSFGLITYFMHPIFFAFYWKYSFMLFCVLRFFLLLVFQVFLGPNIRFVLKMNSDSDVLDACLN